MALSVNFLPATTLTVLTWFLSGSTAVFAQTAGAVEEAKPLWEYGVGALAASQPAYPGAATRTSKFIALPFVIYRGEVLRAEQSNVGLRALKTPRYELDLGFAASLGSSAKDVPARVGMRDIGSLVEFGPRLKINLGDVSSGPTGVWLELPVRGVFDLSHRLENRGASFEPQLSFNVPLPGGWRGGASTSAIFGSQKLNDTFYSVSANEATAIRPAYTAKSGLLATRATLTASKKLTPDLRMLTFVRLDSVSGGANSASSLIQKNTGVSVGLGLAYTLGRSQRTGTE
jgi:MipA family protein